MNQGRWIIKKIVETMLVVTAFSVIERLLGFIYRIFLSRALGAELLGVYQVALSVVGLIMTLTASGIPITVSRIMTKHDSENNSAKSFSTVTAGILLSLILSLPLVLVLVFVPKVSGLLFQDERSFAVFKVIIPGITITSVYSVLRGYFWGKRKFLTYSIIELLEEIVMLVAGVILINGCTETTTGLLGAGKAVLISYIFSFVTATMLYFLRGGRLKNPRGELKPLISSAGPITVMRTGTSLINTLIAIILPMRLVLSGLTSAEALSSFGELSGMSIPLIYIPSTLIGSIALVLVPELSTNYYKNNGVTLKNNVENAVKCSVYISALIIPVFISLGKEIGVLVYDNLNSGLYVQNASIIMLPMSITLITTSVLNSLNLERKTLLYYLIGAFLLILSIWFLPKYVGVYSLVIGLFLSYLTTSCLNLLLINKMLKHKPKLKSFIALSALFIIPSTLLSHLLKGVLIKFIPLAPTVIICSALAVLFIMALYKTFNLFSVKDILGAKKAQTKKAS